MNYAGSCIPIKLNVKLKIILLCLWNIKRERLIVNVFMVWGNLYFRKITSNLAVNICLHWWDVDRCLHTAEKIPTIVLNTV